jgi:hypothetical protein
MVQKTGRGDRSPPHPLPIVPTGLFLPGDFGFLGLLDRGRGWSGVGAGVLTGARSGSGLGRRSPCRWGFVFLPGSNFALRAGTRGIPMSRGEPWGPASCSHRGSGGRGTQNPGTQDAAGGRLQKAPSAGTPCGGAGASAGSGEGRRRRRRRRLTRGGPVEVGGKRP